MPSHDRRLYTAAQVRDFDRHAIDVIGIDGYTLMQRAAQGAWQLLAARWPQAQRIVVACGPGNNGGDGFELAAIAVRAGRKVTVLAVSESSSGDAGKARQACIDAGVPVKVLGKDADVALPTADVLVDALFGTGLSRAPEGLPKRLIEAINAHSAPVLALDIPSGLAADSGAMLGATVKAAVTPTFVAHKRGLFTAKGADCAGERHLFSLDIPESARAQHAPDAMLMALPTLPRRDFDSHKGAHGHVLCIGGDHGTSGAIRMTGEAALRTGAGLVSIATRSDNLLPIGAARPELMAHAVDDVGALKALLDKASVLALGPGLGQGDWGRSLWHRAIDSGLPLVLDADGLNLLASAPRALHEDTILTPHPGEAARLLDTDTASIQADRFNAVRQLASRYHAVAVLKGAGSLVADPQGRVAVCPWGNPGMASGGMGDLLTGVIAALRAQHLSAWEAAVTGVAAHARAGDVAARNGERGLIATELLAPLRAEVNRHD
ncbi:NAD(P)H-hydrate dehydratase [Oleiagrimonas sp. C23AA]|uniref:NAD(P)H-hydrate dehydratase n=1 Tax=Oleiagrimonas sp. C23AA TaxID=2719047 RepID=UPI001420A96D|nr:NAD(P)H-hydrate dehydratase [Oleiagrimonas sp. C23AA]NII09133.1 NAD(P)H-hydrate dehydratase [Oleiagrimonas sp. C23AA]